MQVGVIGLILLAVTGCVSQAQYDRIIEQLHAIRNELNVARAEDLALTREVEELKSRIQKAKRDLLAASDELQRVREEAEAERYGAEGQFVTLQRAVGQLNAQLLTLRDKLAEAKNDTVALNEVVAAYQRKWRAEFEERVLAPPVASDPELADVRLLAPPELETVREATIDHPPQEAAPTSPERGLLAAVLEWLVSLWRAIVAFVRGLFA
jgi:hypothetical protein